MSKIPKVNSDNEIIGETTVKEAVENGWPRRVARVFLFNNDGEILLQKRSSTMLSFPGMWDQSAAGHVDVGEDNFTTANRELEEELGVNDIELYQITDCYKNSHGKEQTFDAVYKGKVSSGANFEVDKNEVSEIKWFSIADFEAEILNNPDKFVPPFVEVWNTFKTELVK